MVLHIEMTPFLILRKALLGVAKLGDKRQIWCLCQIVDCVKKKIHWAFYLRNAHPEWLHLRLHLATTPGATQVASITWFCRVPNRMITYNIIQI